MVGFELGDLIYESKPYVYVLNNDLKGKRCDCCFMKRQEGLKRCSQCSFMYFCNRDCQTKAWETHKVECKYIKKANPNLPTSSLRLLANILLKIKKFGMDEPYENIYGHKMSFNRLMSHSDEIKQDVKACQRMIGMLQTLKQYIGESNIPPPSEFIDIFGKMCINTFSICDGEMQSIGSGVYLGDMHFTTGEEILPERPSIFDHSCEPDAEVVFNGTTMCVRAVKKISHKDVTRIYISYIEQLQCLQDRQNSLKEQYYFCCQCYRCTSSYHEDLMTNTLIDKTAAEAYVTKFQKDVDSIKQMKKDKISASKIYKACLEVLEEQDGILADTHIYHVKILELAFDSCIESSQWADAVLFGKQLIEPYKLLYGIYHPMVGIHLFKVGKIQNFQGLTESARTNLLQAEDILKVTHGTDHSLYKNLLEILHQCEVNINDIALEES